MKSATEYLTFNTTKRRELIRITEKVQSAVERAGIAEGMVLASATPTSRTCSSTTRRSSRSPPAASTSGPGSRSSTARSTATAPSAW